MKTKFTIFIIVCSFYSCQQTPENQSEKIPEERVSGYDANLARELGADDYGMSKFVMAFLKAGPNRNQDSATVVSLQRAHMDNINRLADEGKLVLAGPFLDNGSLRGIYIFDVSSVEEAKELTASDPAIQAGRLEMELHPWYGSAALKKIVEIHNTISKENP